MTYDEAVAYFLSSTGHTASLSKARRNLGDERWLYWCKWGWEQARLEGL